VTKLPRISGNQMIKYLTKKGFVQTRQKGRHVSMRSQEQWTTIPAGNHDLGIGLILTILKDVNISRDEFISDWEQGLIK